MNHNALFRHSLSVIGLTLLSMSGCEKPAAQSAQESSGAAPPTSAQSSPTIEASPNTEGNAVRAYIDPATGKLREPTPEEVAALAAAEAAQKKSATGAQDKTTQPKEVRLPNGVIKIELGDSGQTTLQGCVAKDGDVKMEHDCESKPGETSR
jgi:hypothetical protein